MRIFSIVFLLAGFNVQAQVQENNYNPAAEISVQEKKHYEGLNIINGTLASANFDVKYYRCEWEVDPAVYYITGKVTVYYVITSAASSISFDLMNSLNVDSVKQRNALLSRSHTGNLLQVNFPAPVNAGTLDSVSIYYKGPPANTGFGSFVQTTHGAVPVIWTLSEPYGSRDWWPCKNGLDDKADSIDIIITNPAAFKAASNGLLQGETLIAGGTKKVAYWKHRYPIASYLVCFAVTNYAVFNNSVQLGAVNLPMQTYCYPESLASFQNGTQNVLDAIKYFHGIFGDYPFIKEKYGHVQFGWGGGMEHQTASFLVSINESLSAHELGHQWFGDKITCASWEDIWLNEGFATHLAAMYMENKYPANTIANRRSVVNNITSATGGSVKVDDTSNVGRIFSGRLSYNKGSYLLYMLRWKLGDEVFFRAIRKYQSDPAVIYGFAKTTDLQRNLEAESGLDLSKFFKDWFEGQGYPSYKVEWSQIGSSYVKVRMSQTTSHTSVSFFDLPVALKFKNASQEKTIVVDNKVNDEVFLRNIGFVADTVLVDPDYWLVTRNNTTKKIADAVTGQNVVQVYPNPVADRFYVYLRNFTSPVVAIRLHNMAGQLIYNKSFSLLNGSEYLEIPSAYLAAGQYIFTVVAGKKVVFVKKLVK
ncbi:MAG: T9SS type A sorting domain-containing protein [Ferruginibacter sp.]|nr:T9SS type A sorting domain-containing protein [Ferruginibacter sp.]MBU9935653.1 T9SS type A sorting domain-containing protein [Ferruginibacter sp.]